ncbi:hypothetical protein [Kallotenue papyrolyticum]|uniref:hypothetical protein n=1 Tax=Kallotenue papyrolyticum TaxID=1325125 RepID=UPI0004786210|nr:hypothetical protein [Kallotenue papyrolyticum]
MTEKTPEQASTPPAAESPLTAPPTRLREPTPDDQEIEIVDPDYDLPLDDSDRLREDAEALKD